MSRQTTSMLMVTCESCRVTKVGKVNFRRHGNSKIGYEYTCNKCKEEHYISSQRRCLELREKERRQRCHQLKQKLQRALSGEASDIKEVRWAGRSLLLSSLPLQKQHRASRQFIYTLVDPRTNSVRYVGRTSNPEKRYKQHLHSGSKGAKREWIIELKSVGLHPLITIVEDVRSPTKRVEEREKRWLFHYFQQGAQLVNYEARWYPSLVKVLHNTKADLLNEPVNSRIWYPLYCAVQLDTEEHLRRDLDENPDS